VNIKQQDTSVHNQNHSTIRQTYTAVF